MDLIPVYLYPRIILPKILGHKCNFDNVKLTLIFNLYQPFYVHFFLLAKDKGAKRFRINYCEKIHTMFTY